MAAEMVSAAEAGNMIFYVERQDTMETLKYTFRGFVWEVADDKPELWTLKVAFEIMHEIKDCPASLAVKEWRE